MRVQNKLDRACDDRLAGKITDELAAEVAGMGAAARISTPRNSGAREGQSRLTVTGSKIIELAKNAHNLFIQQDSTEQVRLLKTLLSNCTFDRRSLSATHRKPFDLLAEGNGTGNWLGIRHDFRNWLMHAA
jgi:hypothetical protein